MTFCGKFQDLNQSCRTEVFRYIVSSFLSPHNQSFEPSFGRDGELMPFWSLLSGLKELTAKEILTRSLNIKHHRLTLTLLFGNRLGG